MNKKLAGLLLAATSVLAGCGGDSTKTYVLGGTILGLTTSGLTLANLDVPLDVPAGATTFTFPIRLPAGANYRVAIASQPAGLTCAVTGGSGVITSNDVLSVGVGCVPARYGVSGTVSGLTGAGLVLANGTDVTSVSAGATQFSLPSHVTGSSYAVVVQTQPAGQRCAVTAGSGTLAQQAVTNVQVTCASHQLYVASDVANLVDVLPIDATGQPLLSAATQTPTDGAPRRLVTSPDGNHLYVCAALGNMIDMYDIAADGTLTPMRPVSVDTDEIPNGIAFTPDGRFAYAVSARRGPVMMFAVASNGVLSPLSPAKIVSGDGATSASITADGKWLYVANSGTTTTSMFAIGADGQLAPLATPTVSTPQASDIVLTADGQYAYAVSGSGIREFRIQADGTLARLGDVTANLSTPNDMVISPDGKTAYAPNWLGNTVTQFSIGLDGILTPLSPATVPTGDGPATLALSTDGRTAYVGNARDNTLNVFHVNGDGTLAASSMTTAPMPQRAYHLLFR